MVINHTDFSISAVYTVWNPVCMAMWVSVCVCVCLYLWMCECFSVCVCVCVWVHVNVWMFWRMHTKILTVIISGCEIIGNIYFIFKKIHNYLCDF